MANDQRKRQKKLERKAAKRKEKKHDLVRRSAGALEQLAAAAKYPILHCWISNSVEENGLGWVILSREFPNGLIAVASFLVDRYCLGVKNVMGEVLSRLAYSDKYLRKMHTEMPSRTVAAAEGRKLIEEAVAYARSLGLPPHPDYVKALLLFGTVDPAESNARFEFGEDGKPLYVAGPNDTMERSQQILAILNRTAGPGQFHYLMPVSGSHLIDVVPLDEEAELALEDREDDERDEQKP